MCSDRVQSIAAATAGVKEFIASQVVVIDGGNSPLLLPRDIDTLLSTSVQLSAMLGQLVIHLHSTLVKSEVERQAHACMLSHCAENVLTHALSH